MNGRVTRHIAPVVARAAAAADIVEHIDDMHRGDDPRALRATRRDLRGGMHARCSNRYTDNERDLT